MKVAIVHDWLVAPGGAEKVLEQIIECFPDADLFSLVDFLEDRRPLGGKPVTTSFIQSLPFARRRYRAYLPLMPLAVEQFDLSGYDLIITSSYALARGVPAGPDQTHVSYVHSPMRYAWDLQHQYLREAKSDARAEVMGRARMASLSARLGFALGEQRRPSDREFAIRRAARDENLPARCGGDSASRRRAQVRTVHA